MTRKNLKNIVGSSIAGHPLFELEQVEARLFLSAYVVNTLSDAINPGNGLLTLRQAVADADAHHGANAITFDPKVFTPGSLHTVELTQGQIEFNNSSGTTTVDGPGDSVLAVNGEQDGRIIQISSGVSVSMSGLTITNGAVNTAAGVTAICGGNETGGDEAQILMNVFQQNTVTDFPVGLILAPNLGNAGYTTTNVDAGIVDAILADNLFDSDGSINSVGLDEIYFGPSYEPDAYYELGDTNQWQDFWEAYN